MKLEEARARARALANLERRPYVVWQLVNDECVVTLYRAGDEEEQGFVAALVPAEVAEDEARGAS